MLHIEDPLKLSLIEVGRDTLNVKINDLTLSRARLDLLVDTDGIV